MEKGLSQALFDRFIIRTQKNEKYYEQTFTYLKDSNIIIFLSSNEIFSYIYNNSLLIISWKEASTFIYSIYLFD